VEQKYNADRRIRDSWWIKFQFSTTSHRLENLKDNIMSMSKDAFVQYYHTSKYKLHPIDSGRYLIPNYLGQGLVTWRVTAQCAVWDCTMSVRLM
jgi:hypothetical protein